MSQEALAAKARVNRVTIARLEAAAHPPGIDTLDRIACALGVTLVDLVR
jgi:transcriptional regulator with XRE-family HTH domain